MRLLVIAWRFAALRNYESVVHGLVRRGHDVELAALQADTLGGLEMVRRWQTALPGLRVTWAPSRQSSDTEAFTRKIRYALDWVRYLAPAYRDAPRLIARARDRTPRAMLWLTNVPGARTTLARRMLREALRNLERALPRVPAVDRFLQDRRPDVVMLTPLIGLGSPELDYLRSAQALGFRTLFGVWSWDNLSSKALIRWVPDVITVWNGAQQREALELHGVPAERVVITGAQCFDQWFDRTPSRDHAAFCASVGLPSSRPFVLYVCSALFRGSPIEAEFARRWLMALRASADSRLRDLPVLVRPHPSRLKEWSDVSLDNLGPVVVWGRNPIDAQAKADYFDSLSHAAAVIGLNTSAFLEAAIAGRPVLTVLLEEFRDNQEGTLHFAYLLNLGGGLLHTSRTLDEHLEQLSEVLVAPDRYAQRSRRFVETFLRPYGLGEPATPRVIAALETLAIAPVRQTNSADAGLVARYAAAALRRAYGSKITRSLFWDPRQAHEEHNRTRRMRKHRRLQQADAQARQAKKRAKAERLRGKRRRRRRPLRERLRAAMMNGLRRTLGGSEH